MASEDSLDLGSESGDEQEELVPFIDVDEVEDSDIQELGKINKISVKKKKKKSIQSRCSVKKLKELVDGLTEEQRELVRQMGFGGILDIAYIRKGNRVASMWILQHVDEIASAISIGHLRVITFDNTDFGKVLGVPAGGAEIPTETPKHVVDDIRKILGIGESETRMSVITEIVKTTYPEKMDKKQEDAFKVAFGICAVTYLLSPQLKFDYFFTDYWVGLHTPELIKMYDWGKLVKDGILVTARRVKSDLYGGGNVTSNLTGCTHGLQVFYLDNLDMGDENLPHNIFPRMKVYTPTVMNRILALDKTTGRRAEVAIYGRLLPRKSETVCYSRSNTSIASSSSLLNNSDRSYKDDPLLEEIAAILSHKVDRYASNCKEAMKRANHRGIELNRKHAEGWQDIIKETNETIELETTNIRESIQMVTDAARRSRQHNPASNEGQYGTQQTGAGVVNDYEPSNTASEGEIQGEGGGGMRSILPSARQNIVVEAEKVGSVQGCMRNRLQKTIISRCRSPIGTQLSPTMAPNDESFVDTAEVALDSLLEAATARGELNQLLDENGDDMEIDEHRPLSILPPPPNHKNATSLMSMKDKENAHGCANKDLMNAFSEASSSAERGNKRTRVYGSDHVEQRGTNKEDRIICTPVQTNKNERRDMIISPISREKEVAASELAYREDLDAAALNLNMPETGSILTQPVPARKVKPGKFARSPFVQGYEPPTRARTEVKKLYKYFMKMCGDQMTYNWIISKKPKYIELSADNIKHMLRPTGDLDTDMMNIAMRRYQQMDSLFAKFQEDGRGNGWRLFIEADFANHVKREDDMIELKYIQDIFLGDHLTFKVHLCTEFVMPVKFGVNWSAYIWDFNQGKIIVLDPTMNNGDESDKEIQSRHRVVALSIHRELGKCIGVFFPGWEPNMSDWDVFFPTGLTIGVYDLYLTIVLSRM
ncbi:unnamed protein product [Alopecurus aequalis]